MVQPINKGGNESGRVILWEQVIQSRGSNQAWSRFTGLSGMSGLLTKDCSYFNCLNQIGARLFETGSLLQLSIPKFIVVTRQIREGDRHVYRCLKCWRVVPGLGKGYGVRPPRRLR